MDVKATEGLVQQKVLADSIDLHLSVGAFKDNALIGFILKGIDCVENIKTAYNAGTGIIPTERGKKISEKLYELNIEILRQNNIKQIVLEVITTNKFAINLYKRIGFEISKNYNCFKGTIQKESTFSKFEIRTINSIEQNKLDSFIDFIPSWQNSSRAINSLTKQLIFLGAFNQNEIVGYLVYNPITNKTLQYGVDKGFKNKGIENSLFQQISLISGKEIFINNIDELSTETNNTLVEIGLSNFIQQYEMKLYL